MGREDMVMSERYGLSSERAIVLSIDLEMLNDTDHALAFEIMLDEEQKEMNSITIQRKDMEKILEILHQLDDAIQKLRKILNNDEQE